MANRPGSLANLTKKKSVGAQQNFADTFNWVVACVSKLRGGAGVKINWPAPDTPQIDIQDDGGDGGDGGGGGGAAVDCVTDVGRGETTIDEYGYTATENLSVAYSTGQTKTVPLPSNNGVADIEEESISDGKKLTVTYENAKPEKTIEVPYKNEFEGTDHSYTRRDTDFRFFSASDSNVTVKCVGDALTIGVYYT